MDVVPDVAEVELSAVPRLPVEVAARELELALLARFCACMARACVLFVAGV